MKTMNNTLVLENSKSFSVNTESIDYTDDSGTRVRIPLKLLVQLYEGAKYDFCRKGIDWEIFCKDLFRNKYF